MRMLLLAFFYFLCKPIDFLYFIHMGPTLSPTNGLQPTKQGEDIKSWDLRLYYRQARQALHKKK